MTVTIDFVEIGLGVSNEFHHACQILVFVVAAIEFKLAVAADEHQRRTVVAHPVEWGILVDGGLQRGDALHLADVVMGDGLSAERHIHHHLVGIDAVGLQPSLVQAEHHGEIAAGRVACDNDFLDVAAIFADVVEHPRNGFGSIVDGLLRSDLRQQSVVGADHHISFLLQLCGNLLAARLESSPVEPHDDGTTRLAFGVVDVEFQPFSRVGIRFFRITHVVDLSVGLSRCARNGQAKQQQSS